MGRFIVAVRAVFVVAVLAAAAVWWLGCDDNGANSGGGDSYESVTIGGKKWMKKNLNIKTADSWCYENSEGNCAKYGRLYTWFAAKSACQSIGWRLPDTADWNRLVTAAGGRETAGNKLKSTYGWEDNGNGTDWYGFSALPGGHRESSGMFDYDWERGNWWTATEYVREEAYYRYMGYYNGVVSEDYDYKGRGFSVRCVSD